MKKFLVAVVLGVSLLFGGGSALAQNVGEPMPSLEGTTSMGENLVSANAVMRHLHKGGGCSHNVVYLICDGKETPIGIFDINTGKLYLDNAPVDGIIDSIVTENYPPVQLIVPDCPK